MRKQTKYGGTPLCPLSGGAENNGVHALADISLWSEDEKPVWRGRK